MHSFDPLALECLAAVVEHGGFDRAARHLAVTQSAVSQRVRALETQVGTVLLVRHRPIKATPAGQLLLKHTQMLRLLRTDLDKDLRELAPSSTQRRGLPERLAVAINADSIATWALPALTPLVRQGAALEIIHDDQDFTHEWLREGQVLGCVTSVNTALRGCRMEALGTMPYVAVASPDFVQAVLGGGLSRHNFVQTPFIAFNRKDDLQHTFVRTAFGLATPTLQQRYVPSSEGQVRAALAGWGVAVVPQLLAAPHVASGQLQNVLPEHTVAVDLYWHCWNLASDVLERLSAALRAAARAHLTPLA